MTPAQDRPIRFRPAHTPLALLATAWPRTCHVDFEVLPGAVPGQALRYSLVPVDFCGWDVDTSDNHVDFVFGTPTPPAAPAQPVPLAAWPLALLVLALLAVVRLARLRATLAPNGD